MLAWDNIETVLLDMDGTLLDLQFDNFFWLTYLPQRYAEFHQITIEAAQSKLEAHIDHYRGTLQWYCLDHWSELVGMDIAALKQEIAHKVAIRPGAERFLRWLKQNGKDTILLTNAHRAGMNIKLEASGIDRWLDKIISSHDYQEPKESENFWHHFADNHEFNPQKTLFIDDTEQILHQAKAFGIQHLIYIAQPDSNGTKRRSEHYQSLHDFSEIMRLS